jgi:cytochrome c oxidase subunit 2
LLIARSENHAPTVRAALSLSLCGVGLAVLSGCGETNETQNALQPHSHQAQDIANLFWVMMIGAWIGLGIVVVLLFWGWGRARRRGPGGGRGKPGERGAWFVVVGLGVIVPIVVLASLFVVSNLFIIRTTDAPAASETRLTVVVVGHQWWWEVRYPQSGAVTANELHIPARTPVRVEVRTADVIHSFWVPELNRKVDAIPDKTNVVELDANRVGTYRGQCAEFCGVYHSQMPFTIVGVSRPDYEAWLAAQQAATPSGQAVGSPAAPSAQAGSSAAPSVQPASPGASQ